MSKKKKEQKERENPNLLSVEDYKQLYGNGNLLSVENYKKRYSQMTRKRAIDQYNQEIKNEQDRQARIYSNYLMNRQHPQRWVTGGGTAELRRDAEAARQPEQKTPSFKDWSKFVSVMDPKSGFNRALQNRPEQERRYWDAVRAEYQAPKEENGIFKQNTVYNDGQIHEPVRQDPNYHGNTYNVQARNINPWEAEDRALAYYRMNRENPQPWVNGGNAGKLRQDALKAKPVYQNQQGQGLKGQNGLYSEETIYDDGKIHEPVQQDPNYKGNIYQMRPVQDGLYSMNTKYTDGQVHEPIQQDPNYHGNTYDVTVKNIDLEAENDRVMQELMDSMRRLNRVNPDDPKSVAGAYWGQRGGMQKMMDAPAMWISDQQLEAEIPMMRKFAEGAEQKERKSGERSANEAAEMQAAVGNAERKQDIFVELNTMGLPVEQAPNGQMYVPDPEETPWGNIDAMHRIQSRPADYDYSDDKRYEYDKMVYDLLHGNGAYDTAIDEAQTDEEFDAIDSEIEDFWNKLENKGFTEEMNESIDETYELRKQDRGDYNSRKYRKREKELEEEKERRAEVQRIEALAPDGDGEYIPENVNFSLFGHKADQLYYYANMDLGGEDVSDAKRYMGMRPESFMTAEQLKIFNNFYNSGDKDGALEYYNALKPYLDEIQLEFKSQLEAKMSTNGYAPIMIANRVLTAPIGGIASDVGIGLSLLGNEDAGKRTSGWYSLSRTNMNIQNAQAQAVGEKFNELFGPGADRWGQLLVGTVYSISDNLTAMAMAGGAAGVNAGGMAGRLAEGMIQLIMSSEAAGQNMVEKLDAGVDPTEAAISSIGTGAIEWITEKVSIESLLKPDVRELMGKPGEMIKYLAKNTIAEGSEEIASGGLGVALDAALSALYGHENEIEARARELREANPDLSEEEALKQSWLETAEQIGMEGLAGAFSGLVMSGGRGALNRAGSFRSIGRNISAQGNQIDGKSGTQQLIDAAAGMTDTASQRMAEDLQKKLGRGKGLSNYEIGQLAYNMMQDTGDQHAGIIRDTMQNRIKSELMDAGMVKDRAAEAAAAMAKSLSGEQLTDADMQAISKDERAINLWKEYNSSKSKQMEMRYEIETASEGVRSVADLVSDLADKSGRATSAVAADVAQSIRNTGSMDEAIDDFAHRNSFLMSEQFAEKAKDLLKTSKSAQASKNYLDDAMKIRISAMSLATSMPQTHLDRETAQALWNEAKAEFDEAEAQRVLNHEKLPAGKGIATFNGAEFGTDAWKQALKDTAGLSGTAKLQMTTIGELAQRMGLKVNFINDSENKYVYGWEDAGTGAITINVAGQETSGLSHHMLTTMSHEMTHWLEQNSSEGYASLRQFVVDHLRESGVDVEQRMADLIANQNAIMKGSETGELLDLNGAMAEIVAQGCEELLSSQALRDKLQTENKSLYGRIKEYAVKFIRRLDAAIRGMENSSSREARQLRQWREDIAKIWLGAQEEAMGRAAGGTTKDGKIQMSVAMRNASLTDVKESYETAIRNGNDAAAREALDAYAAKQGYTDRAYHGTSHFGFTKIDIDQGDGTFFVAYNPELASTYTKTGDVKNITDRELSTMSGKELAKYVQGISEESGEGIEGIRYNPATTDFSVTHTDEDGNSVTETYSREDLEGMVEGYREYDESLPEGDRSRALRSTEEGIYDLYTRPGKQLVVDAKGSSWRAIPFKLENYGSSWEAEYGSMPEPSGWKTRDIAAWAKENGYDSVRINNVYDNGMRREGAKGFGDIGIFFDGNDVKSADLITQDDSGKEIGIGDRFNDKQADIRYSVADVNKSVDENANNLIADGRKKENDVKALLKNIKNVQQLDARDMIDLIKSAQYTALQQYIHNAFEKKGKKITKNDVLDFIKKDQATLRKNAKEIETGWINLINSKGAIEYEETDGIKANGLNKTEIKNNVISTLFKTEKSRFIENKETHANIRIDINTIKESVDFNFRQRTEKDHRGITEKVLLKSPELLENSYYIGSHENYEHKGKEVHYYASAVKTKGEIIPVLFAVHDATDNLQSRQFKERAYVSEIIIPDTIVKEEQIKKGGLTDGSDLNENDDRITAGTTYGASISDLLDNVNADRIRSFDWEAQNRKRLSYSVAQRDQEYADAVARGDWDKAESMLIEKMQQTEGITGYNAARFNIGEGKEIANLIKKGDTEAIRKAVEEMAPKVPENAVLIPMPPHDGIVTEDTDTYILAKALGEATGVPVINALESDPHISRREAKDNGINVNAESMGFRQIMKIPEGKMPVFIDNMVGGGQTAIAAKNAVGKGITLAYAQSPRSKARGVKFLSVTYDKEGNLIPLSQRMDPEKNWKYSVQQDSEEKAFSVARPEMDVISFMEGLNENNMATAQEKTMVRQFKELRAAMDVARHALSDRTRKLRELEAKQNPSAYDRSEMQRMRIMVQNSADKLDRLEKDMIRVTSDKGYAKMMSQQSAVMDNLVSGRTADAVRQTVEALTKDVETLTRDMDERQKKINILRMDLSFRERAALVDMKQAENVAGLIRKEYGSSINKRDLVKGIAEIRLMIAAGQNIDEAAEELAWKIAAKTKGEGSVYLDMLRGKTIVIGPGALKELKGQNSSLKEVRSALAGTGIKVKTGTTGTLDSEWSELCDMIPSLNRDTGEKDQLDEFLRLIRSEKASLTGETMYESHIAEVAEDLKGWIASVGTTTGTKQDPEAVKLLAQMNEMNTQQLAEVRKQMVQLLKDGRLAMQMTAGMQKDVEKSIEYNNLLAEQSEAAIWKQEKWKLKEQLQNEKTQALLAEQAKWKERIEKDKRARDQAESNQQKKQRINTALKRMNNLLKNPKGLNNIPEYMQGLAREVLTYFVDNDLSGGQRLTMGDHNQLLENKRLLDAWEQQNGKFNLADLNAGEEVVTLTIAQDLQILDDAIREWSGKIQGKNFLDGLQKRGEILTRIADAVGEIYNAIKAEQEVQIGNRRVAVEDAAYKVAQGTKGKRHREWTGAVGQKISAMHKFIVSGNLTPEYFFRMLGNEGLSDLWDNYHRAENRNGLELRKAKNRIEEISKQHGYDQWNMEEKKELKLESGDTVQMTTGQLMSLWATWKREKTLGPAMSEHLTQGGFYVEQNLNEGVLGRTEVEKKSHRVTEADMAQVREMLTDEQRKFVDDVVLYMSRDMSELGNAASMAAYGIKLYKEAYYFPFQMWDGVKNRKSNDAGSAAGSQNQAFHPSFSKTRMHGANNAIVIGDFMQTAADHITGMINYATMGLANESLNKVLNQKTAPEPYQTLRNTRAILEEAYGREAMQYLMDLKVQLEGGAVRASRSFGDKAISMFRKNAVAGSMSVALQQPLSYIRAAMMISPKYMTKALMKEYWKGSYKELLEHSGVAVIKDMGRFDMNAGQSAREYLMPEGKESTARKVWDKAGEYSTILPEKMDAWTWTRMWVAVKAEQHAEHPEMDMKSDEFLDLCGERFNDIMRRTQVYDSTLVKSQNMRSDNYWMKGLTSFMAEPTLSINVLADAVRSARTGEKGSKLQMGKAAATFLLSAIMQAAIKAGMSTGRSPEEQKTWWENFLYRFEQNLINEANPFSLIPGYSDAVDLLKNGEVSDDAMGAIGKLLTAGKNTISLLVNGPGQKGLERDLEDSVAQLVQLFTNIPAKNLMRDGRAMLNWITVHPYAKRPNSGAVIRQQAKAAFWTADNMIGAINAQLGEAGYKTDNNAYYTRIYNAMKSGNAKEQDDLIEYLLKGKGVKKEGTIWNNVKKKIKDEYALGRISRSQAEKLMRQAQPGIKDRDLMEALDEVEYEKQYGDVDSYSNYTPLKEAILANDAKRIGEAKSYLMDNGYTEKEVVGKMKSFVKENYKNDKIDRKEAERQLKEFDPKITAKDIADSLDEIEYEKDHGDVDSYSNYTPMQDAIDNGNKAEVEKQKSYLKTLGYEETEINSQISSYIMKGYKDGDASRAETEKKLKTFRPDLSADDLYWMMDRADYKKETGKDAGSSKYYRLWDAMDGNKADAIGTAITTMKAHGVEVKSIKSQISSHYKQAYLKGNSEERRRIRDAMQKAYKKLGYTAEDANNIINKWK